MSFPPIVAAPANNIFCFIHRQLAPATQAYTPQAVPSLGTFSAAPARLFSLTERASLSFASMESSTLVYSFQDPVAYLRYRLEQRRFEEPKHSLRRWARELGYEHPSYLSNVLQGERRLTPELATRLADNLALRGKARRYFDFAVLRQLARNDLEKNTYGRRMRELRPGRAPHCAGDQLEWRLASEDWTHETVLTLSSLAQPARSLDQLYARLGGAVPKRRLRRAVNRLTRLGLLRALPAGHFTPTEAARTVKWSAPLAREGAERIALGLRALRRDRPPPGELVHLAAAIPEARWAEARQVLERAAQALRDLGAPEDAAHVYQVNLQIFRLTAEPRQMAGASK